MKTGTIVKVSGPLVIAEGMRDANMFDVVRVSDKHLIGEIIPHKKYYYRLGYCPLALSGDFAKTITFLTPGMYGTPEYRLIQDIDNAKERYAISRSKENITSLRKHGETDDFDAIKYFHAHGIPQVIASDKDFFDYT